MTSVWRQQRMQALAGGAQPRAGSRLRAELTAEGAELWLYDVIDPWGGYWGVSASEIVAALQGAAGPVTLHINSPGGDVFEAIAIHDNLLAHATRLGGGVTVRVEGVAASAASVIMLAGNRVEVGPHAQVMIHDAWGMEMGNAAALAKYSELLDRTSQNLACMYAAKAGGDPDEWRERMRAETWYVGGAEAVAAGLADAVTDHGAGGEQGDKDEVAAAWDLSVYAKAPFGPVPKPEAENINSPVAAAPVFEFDPDVLRRAVREARA